MCADASQHYSPAPELIEHDYQLIATLFAWTQTVGGSRLPRPYLPSWRRLHSMVVRCVYAVVRLVPDIARGEFVNVGVIAGSDETGEWQARQVQDTRRAVAFAGENGESHLAGVFEWMDRELRHLRQHTDQNAGERYLDDFATRRYRGYNQLTRPAPVVADCVQDALDSVFAVQVADPTAS